MSNILGYYNNEKIKVKETVDSDLNMPIVFVKNANTKSQNLLIDGVPNELYYNPSSKTLFVDNIETKIANLSEGEGILIDNSVDNKTTINVNFDKNTATATTLNDFDTVLLQDSLDFLKVITGANLKSAIRLTAGDNLSYGISNNSNRLNLDSVINNTTLSSGCVWSGNQIDAVKIADGNVSNTEFQRLNGLSSAILQNNQRNAANGVCGLDSNGIIQNAQLPSSVSDIIEVANFSSLPGTGESNKIYVTLDNHKAYRWGGTAYVEISASLVIGTTTGTAYDGGSGQANATAIALKAPKNNAIMTGVLSVRNDTSECLILKTQNSSFLKECSITMSKNNTNSQTNFGIRFDGINLKFGSVNSVLNGTLTQYMRLSSQELLIAGNAHLTSGHNFKIDGSTICQTTKANTGVTLTGGVVSMDIASCTSQSSINGNDIFILQTNATPAVSKKITGTQLISAINGFSFTSPNLLTAANGTDISLNTTLAGLVALTATSNNLDIKTTTNNDIIFSQNNTSIMKISSTGITALNSKQFFGSFSGGADNLILETGLSSGVATNIIFKTNQVQRALLSATKLDLDVDVDLASGKSYKINGTAINKSTVGLGNVDNTSDSGKPISTATQNALAGKQSTLTFGKANGNALKLQETVAQNDFLIMGSSNVIGKTLAETKTLLNINNIVYTIGNQSIAGLKTFTDDLQINGELNVPTISGSSFISTIHTAKIGCVFANNYAGIRHKDSNNTTGYALIQGGDGSTFINSAGTKPLRFRIANVTKMEISALGKVAIGKTPTGRDLDVLGPISSDDAFQLNGVDVVRNEGLSEGTNVWVNCRLLQNRSTLSNDGMYINYDSTGTSNLRFYAGGTSKRMEIFTNGRVGINNSSPSEILHVTGNIRASGHIQLGGMRAGFTGGCTYNSLGGPGSANQIGFKWGSPYMYGRVDNVLSMGVGNASDKRIKRNIKNIIDAESRKFLDLIQPRSYNSAKYEVDGIEISCECDKIMYGGIAQEIEENFPELVYSPEDNGLKSLYNDQISFLTLSSLQMVDKTVTELKKENEELKDKVDELELKLNLIMEKLNI